MSVCQSDSESSMITESSLHLDNAWQAFNECREKGRFCDAVIKVEEQRFPVHRVVLSTCSDYFRSLFLGRWKSSEEQEIEIPGVTPDVMSLLLNFAYTGQIAITPGNVTEILPAADLFLIQYVKDKCCAFLKKQLTPNTCIGIKDYARSYHCVKLVDAATNYILRFFDDVSRFSEEFLGLKYEELKQMTNDDRLNVRVEETVCEAVFRWIEHDHSNRIHYFASLLKCVRMGLLDPEYFENKIKGNKLVREKFGDCHELLEKADEVLSQEQDIIPIEAHSVLLRPRLPFEVLLAIGGWSEGSPTNAIEAFDPRARSWLNISNLTDTRTNRPYRTVADLPRAYHGVAYLKGYVYVIGGFDGVNYFNFVRKMSVSTFQWVQEPSMMHKRCYISVTTLNNLIYALGGMNGETRLNTGETYDPLKKIWHKLPDMNEKRSDASATSLNGKVYIAGGFNGQECLFTAEFYDPESMTWTRITPMRSRRSGVSVISFHGMIYAVGGFDGINRLKDAEAYSPSTNSWITTSNMHTSRSNFGIEVIDDKLIAAGGYNGERTTSNVEAYDDTTNEWYPVKDLYICRSALSCCVITDLPHDVIKKYCMPRDIPLIPGSDMLPPSGWYIVGDHEMDEQD